MKRCPTLIQGLSFNIQEEHSPKEVEREGIWHRVPTVPAKPIFISNSRLPPKSSKRESNIKTVRSATGSISKENFWVKVVLPNVTNLFSVTTNKSVRPKLSKRQVCKEAEPSRS